MRSRLMVILLVSALAMSFVGATASAQTAAARPAATSQAQPYIVLIDLGAIFKEHPFFKARMNELQGDVENAETLMKKKREQLRNMMDELGRIKAGTREYKDFETNVFKFRNELETEIQVQRKEFMSREAKVYHAIYQEVQQEVQLFASQYNISVVLKFSRETPDTETPESIVRDLNKQVLWYAKDLDVTDHIMSRIRARIQSANPAAAPSRPGVPTRN